MATLEDLQFAAHLLRRTSFHLSRTRVQTLAEVAAGGRETLITRLVDQARAPKLAANPGLRNRVDKSHYPDFLRLLKAEVRRLNQPQSGLGDRMLWFWHGFLTTGMSKVGLPGLLWRQHRLLAKHALGNYRQLLIDLTLDPAMLFYLDGNGSQASQDSIPNENYARELMELFSLGRVDADGRANYTQADVTAGAAALAGWGVGRLPRRGSYNPYRAATIFRSEAALTGSVDFLGATLNFDSISTGSERVRAVVDQVLSRPAAATNIVRKLFTYFVHSDPAPETLASLAATFRDHDFEVMPVLKQLFRLPDFSAPQALTGRARLPLEWLLAMLSCTGFSIGAEHYPEYFYAAGQVPFDPPNVAGWTVGDRWLLVTQALARTRAASVAFGVSKRNRLLQSIAADADPVAETLESLLLYDVSEQTKTQIGAMLASQDAVAFDERLGPARAALALALSSPEFALT